MPVVLPVARTSAEAHAYLDLHPCPACGSPDFERTSSVIEADGDLATRYAGPCRQCGAAREVVFALPEHPVAAGPHVFGDGTPSRLLDPGEWMAVADRYASAGPAAPTGTEQQRVLAGRLRSAVAALDEVAAFLPEDQELVPEAAFVSDLGRQVYAAEPGRFYRDRIAVVRQTYSDLLAADGL